MGEAVLAGGVFFGGGSAAGDAEVFDGEVGFAGGGYGHVLPAHVAAAQGHDAGDVGEVVQAAVGRFWMLMLRGGVTCRPA